VAGSSPRWDRRSVVLVFVPAGDGRRDRVFAPARAAVGRLPTFTMPGTVAVATSPPPSGSSSGGPLSSCRGSPLWGSSPCMGPPSSAACPLHDAGDCHRGGVFAPVGIIRWCPLSSCRDRVFAPHGPRQPRPCRDRRPVVPFALWRGSVAVAGASLRSGLSLVVVAFVTLGSSSSGAACALPGERRPWWVFAHAVGRTPSLTLGVVAWLAVFAMPGVARFSPVGGRDVSAGMVEGPAGACGGPL
jgi:hypothetical protein